MEGLDVIFRLGILWFLCSTVYNCSIFWGGVVTLLCLGNPREIWLGVHWMFLVVCLESLCLVDGFFWKVFF